MTPFHVEHPDPDEDSGGQDEVEQTLMDKVRWARDQAAARLTCMIDGHTTDPEEADDYGQAPCLRCGRWIYVD